MIKNSQIFMRRNKIIFKRNKASFITLLVENFLFFLALSYGLGSYITGIQNISYINFLFSGFLMFHVALISFSETFFNHSKHDYLKLISLTSLSKKDFFISEVIWSIFKAILGLTIFLLVSFPFVKISFIFLIYTYFLALLVSLFFSIAGLFFSYYLNLKTLGFSFIFIPLVLISGIYFPQDKLPLPFLVLSYLSPLGESANLLKDIIGFNTGSLYSIFVVLIDTSIIFALFIFKFLAGVKDA